MAQPMKPILSDNCDGRPRRDFLRLGMMAGAFAGLSANQRSIANNSGPAKATGAKACILIWLDGGPSHLESFDPKPDAPVEVRGPLGSIATKVPGVRLGECMERTAEIMDRITLVRSLTSPLGEHAVGTHYMLTGYQPTPVLEYPAYGAALAEVHQPRSVLPAHIAVPKFDDALSGNGFLPTRTAPFTVGGNPDSPNFKVRDLEFYPGLTLDRLQRRKQMVGQLDQLHRKLQQADVAGESALQRAYQLAASQEAKQAFDLNQEPQAIRNLYGRGGGSGIGQSCLLARRLVQRGVPFVTVGSTGWDTHQNIRTLKERFPGDRNAHLPSMDRAFAALVTDLESQGMLDETLVLVMGEFGRTPKINAGGGRDHWPNAYSVAMVGGGVPRGVVVGQSDALGERPADLPVTPADLAATIYTLMGLDPAFELHTSDGRPVRLAPDGAEPIREICGVTERDA